MRRGYLAHRAGKLDQAIVDYQAVLAAAPGHAIALHYAALLGRQLNSRAKASGLPTRDDAVMGLMAASIAANPHNAGAVHNFGKFKHDSGALAEARQLYETAVAIDPEQGDSWVNLGNVYGELGNRMRAEACWIRALDCEQQSPEAVYNIAFLKLLRGNYLEGWRDYNARLESPDYLHEYGRPDVSAPRWDGAPLAGTLFVHGEQGAGDVLMMGRYLPLCQMRCKRVVVEVLRGLVTLFEANYPGVTVIARGDPIPHADAQVPMFSLPSVFETTLETVPLARFAVPSCCAEPRRIGVCWRGSTGHTNDRVRSMPFEAIFPILDLHAARFTLQSLQFGFEVADPLEPCPLGDFLDTAAAIARCETVVTVDTSVAHLAGLMGVRTFLLLPFCAEWRWLQDRSDSPWYPSITLFRQTAAGDWGGPVSRAVASLMAADKP